MPTLPPTPFVEPPRPEQTFFTDPALDRLLGVTTALAAEVYVMRNRLQALERNAAGHGDADVPHEDAADFVARLLAPLLGEQQAKGPL
jgi:hypothetical protein